jgi:hypothetical protein
MGRAGGRRRRPLRAVRGGRARLVGRDDRPGPSSCSSAARTGRTSELLRSCRSPCRRPRCWRGISSRTVVKLSRGAGPETASVQCAPSQYPVIGLSGRIAVPPGRYGRCSPPRRRSSNGRGRRAGGERELCRSDTGPDALQVDDGGNASRRLEEDDGQHEQHEPRLLARPRALEGIIRPAGHVDGRPYPKPEAEKAGNDQR